MLLCLILAPQIGGAAGFGELEMHSRIGQPLRAEVSLLAPTDEMLGSACFSLERIRDADLPVIGDGRVELKREGKRHYLSITTPQPIHEPLALLRLRAGCGSALTRDYMLMPPPPASRIDTTDTPLAKAKPPPSPMQRESPARRKAAPATAPAKPSPAPRERGDRLVLSTSLSFVEPMPQALADETETRLLRMETSLTRLNESLQKIDGALALRREAQALRHQLQGTEAPLLPAAGGPWPAASGGIWRQWLALVFGTLLGGVLSAVALQWLSQRFRPGYRDR